MSNDELTLDDVTEDIEPQIDDEEVEETSEDEEVEETEDSSGNPAWDELYEVLPKSLHGMVKPVVEKWQSGVDSEFEKIAPYRKFAEAGVNPQVIEASMELARQVASNPKAVYDELAERYGWQQASAMVQKAVKDTEDALEDAEESDLFDNDEEGSSELKALKAELDSLKSNLAEQEEYAYQAQLQDEIEASLANIKKEAGDVDEEAIVRRAMLLADDYPDAEIDQLINAAYEQYSGEVEKMRATVKKAPRVAGGNANKVPATPPKTLSTKEDRVSAIEEIVKRALNL
jgi:hypothetical protein